jgi:aminotransferase in exopolysaccharide biosynthesis
LNTLAEEVPRALLAAVGPGPLALHQPSFAGNEAAYLQECIESTYVSSVGPFVDRIERELEAYTGSAHAVAVVNGTAALHVALLLAGVQPGDEVLVPALSFVATANAVHYCGAVPHFVDSSERTLGIDPVAMRAWLELCGRSQGGVLRNRVTGRPIRAVVPMHTFGHPCEIADIMAVAGDFGLAVVEDSAESLGSWFGNRHTGTFGSLGILSFNGNKTITTGGGGAILTDDPKVAERAKHLTTTAKVQHKWEFIHDVVGFNYRMPNVNAALGCAQLEHLPSLLASQRRLHDVYSDAFSHVNGAHIFSEPAGSISNYWLQVLMLEDSHEDSRDSVLDSTNAAGYATRPVWRLLNLLDPYVDCPQAPLPVAESLARRIICLPSSAALA